MWMFSVEQLGLREYECSCVFGPDKILFTLYVTQILSKIGELHCVRFNIHFSYF